MSRPCPNCGAMCAREARFCRLCGTPLRVTASDPHGASPGAATVPLTDEGRTTNGLASEDGSASAPETGRVKRSEMESILRRPAQASHEKATSGQIATDTEAPVTTALSSDRDGKAASAASSVDSSSEASSSSSTVEQQEASENAHATVPSNAQATTVQQQGAGASPVKSRDGVGTRRMWQVAALALLVIAVGAAALAFYYSRRTTSERDAQGTAPISISDQQRLVQEKLAEAEGLLSAGNVTDAIARLRYAIRLDPTNARAHRLLAEALERTGAVNEAIDEYRLATQYDPGNEDTWMRYADALRRVGRTDEAREIYQKLSTSSSEETARMAKEQLAALPPAIASNGDASRDARTQNRSDEENANTSGEQSPPASSTQAGTATAPGASGGAGRPKNDPVESYNTAMRIIQGKDIRKMNRAELIRAYELFQYAQAGPNRAEASRRLRELDKELFERRKGK